MSEILKKTKPLATSIRWLSVKKCTHSLSNSAMRCEAADVTSVWSSLNNELQLALNQTEWLQISVFKRVISAGSSQILFRIFKMNPIAYIYDRFKLQKLNFWVENIITRTINLPGSLRRQHKITQIYPKQH